MDPRSETSSSGSKEGETSSKGGGLFSFISATPGRKRAKTTSTQEKRRGSSIFAPASSSIVHIGSTIARMASKASLRTRKHSEPAVSEEIGAGWAWPDRSSHLSAYEDDEPDLTRHSSLVTQASSEALPFEMRPGILPDTSPPRSFLFPHGMYENEPNEWPRATVEEIGKSHVDVPAPLKPQSLQKNFTISNSYAGVQLPPTNDSRQNAELGSPAGIFPSQQERQPAPAMYDNWKYLDFEQRKQLRSAVITDMSSFTWGEVQQEQHTAPNHCISPTTTDKEGLCPQETHATGSFDTQIPGIEAAAMVEGVAVLGRTQYQGPQSSEIDITQCREQRRERIGKNDSYVQVKERQRSRSRVGSPDFDSESDTDNLRMSKIDTAIRQIERSTRTSQSHITPTFRSRGESIGLPDCSEHAHVKAASFEKRLSNRNRAMRRPVRRSRADLFSSGGTNERFRVCDYMSKLLSVDETGNGSVMKEEGKGKGRMRGETI